MRLSSSKMASLCLILGLFFCFLSSSTTNPHGSTGNGTFTLAAAATATATEEVQEKSTSYSNTRVGSLRHLKRVEVDAEGEMETEEEEEAGDEEEEEEEEEEGDDDEYEEEDEEEDEEDEDEEEDEEDEEEEDEEDDEETPTAKVYIVDDLMSEDGELRGTLILDEISEYSVVDKKAPGGSIKYFKVMLHLYNSGFEPICGITVAISPTEKMEIEQLWTLQQTEDDSDVYEVQWADHVSPDNPRSNSRYFGLITKRELPEVKIDSITPCEEEEEEEEGGEEEWDEDEDGDEEKKEEADEEKEEEGEEGVGKDDGGAQTLSQKKAKAHARLLEEEEERGMEGWREGEVTLAVDQAAEWVQLDILEALALPNTTRGSSSSNVLINARVVNVGETPLCGVTLWIHDFRSAAEYWSLVPSSPEGEWEDGSEEGRMRSMTFLTLPTRNSSLVVGGSHYFGLVVEERGWNEGGRTGGYPNMVVVRASQACGAKL